MIAPRLALLLSFAIACGLPAQQPAPTPNAKAAEASSDRTVIPAELTAKLEGTK